MASRIFSRASSVRTIVKARGGYSSASLLGCNARLSSSAASPLHEFFVMVWNNPSVKISENPENLHFPKEKISLTFAGNMMSHSSSVAGTCFACQAPSEDHIRQLMLSHENSAKGIWDMATAEISALDTVHTSDFAKQ